MAIPARLLQTLLPSEVAFLAEDTSITIVSRQSMEPLDLIGFSLPKLRPLRRVAVPIWAGVLLKKQGRCSLVIPAWLDEDHLKAVYDQETVNRDRFSDRLPWNWVEVAQILLEAAVDDFSSPVAQIRALVQDIREVRQAKARAGLKELNESHMQMDNLGHMELNELRAFACMAMDELRRITSLTEDQEAQPEEAADDDDMDYL